jgi:hypothetical protein
MVHYFLQGCAMGQILHGSATTTVLTAVRPRAQDRVYRQDIFDERIEFGFPGQIGRKLIVRDQMRGQNPWRFTSMRRIAPAPIP